MLSRSKLGVFVLDFSFFFFFWGGGGRIFLRDWNPMVIITIFQHHLGFHIFFPKPSNIQIQVVGEVFSVGKNMENIDAVFWVLFWGMS